MTAALSHDIVGSQGVLQKLL